MESTHTIEAPQSTGILSGITKATEGMDLLGSMTWWSVHKCHVQHAQLEDAFYRANLPLEWLPKPVTPKNAFLKAARHFEDLAKNTVKRMPGVDYLLRKAVDDLEECVMVLVREVRSTGARDVEHTTVAKITLQKDTFAVEAYPSGLASEEILDLLANHPIQSLYTEYKDALTERELRMLLLHIVDRRLMSVSVRDKGGVYFAPRGAHHHLDGLAKMIAEISPGSELSICPIADVARARETLYRSMAEEMRKDLAMAASDISTACGKARSGKGTSMRPKTLAAKLEDFAFLRKKAHVYSTLMAQSAETLERDIAQVESQVRSLL